MKLTLHYGHSSKILILVFFLIFVGFYFLNNPSDVRASTCLQLNSDISYGMSDQTPPYPIYLLQEDLQSFGYLSATPNGHFGPATLSAVEMFQTNNDISSTGYVGPLTRAAITQKTCVANTTSNSTSVQSNFTTNNTILNSSSNTGVTSPGIGEVLPIGSSYVIRWNNPPSSIFNVMLEQPNGIGAGFIAQDISNGSNQYIWNVGNVFSSQTQMSQDVASGTYRIRLENPSTGPETSDELSGWFTLIPAQLAINSITPPSAFADNYTSVILYGSDFTNSTGVYFDTNLSGIRANNVFVSADGRVLVFTIPTTVSTGSHELFISNGYNSSPASVSFTVTAE